MTRQKESREPGRAIAAGERESGACTGAPSATVYHNSGQRVKVDGRTVGIVEGDAFKKDVRGSKHQLRKPAAWAFDLGSLADAESLGARFVELHDTESGRTWRAAIATIRARGFPVNRGFGAQVGLALDQFKQDEREPVAAQLAFSFGGVA